MIAGGCLIYQLNVITVLLVFQDYKFLTFARIPPPAPPPWVETHALLQRAITVFVRYQASQLSQPQHRTLASAASELSLDWYTGMLARLHINSFRLMMALLNYRTSSKSPSAGYNRVFIGLAQTA